MSASPYLCSGCLHLQCIQNNDLYLYVQDLLLLKQKRVVDTKLRFCLSVGSVNVISRSYNNRPLGNKSVFLDPQLEIITASEKENVIIAEKFNKDSLLTKSLFFFI